jgi:hypothetical protein
MDGIGGSPGHSVLSWGWTRRYRRLASTAPAMALLRSAFRESVQPASLRRQTTSVRRWRRTPISRFLGADQAIGRWREAGDERVEAALS